MFASFPGSFVRSSSSSTNTAVDASHEPATRVSMPPWIQPVHNPLPRSLYPILPPPTPYYARAQPVVMSRSSSAISTDSDTVMADTQYCEDEDESEFDSKSEDETLDIVRAGKALAIKKKKNAVKAAQAVTKRTSPKRSARATKTCNKTTTSSTSVGGNQGKKASMSDSDSPAKCTRSSARSQQPKAQITGHREVEMVPLEPTKKFKTRKTWIPEDKAVLKVAVRHWWRAGGAARHNYPTKIVLPKKRSDECWEWIWLECKKMNEKFDRNEIGLANVAWKMNDNGLI